MLLERDYAQLVRAGDGACIRLERPRHQFQKCALSASIRTQQPEPLSRPEQEIEIRYDRTPAERFAELSYLDQLFRPASRGGEIDASCALVFSSVGAVQFLDQAAG